MRWPHIVVKKAAKRGQKKSMRLLILALCLVSVGSQIFSLKHALDRTPDARALYFKERSEFRANKYLIWAKKWYKDAMTRIDKQIHDDEGDGEDEDDALAQQRSEKLARMCKKAKTLRSDTCETFGQDTESCRTITTEFNHKCIRGSGSDPFFFVWFCAMQLYAATELDPENHNVFKTAGLMSLNLHRSPDGPIIYMGQVLGYTSKACRLHKPHCSFFYDLMRTKGGQLYGNVGYADNNLIKRQARGLKAMADGSYSNCCSEPDSSTGCCLVEMTSDPLAQLHVALEVPSKEQCDTQGKCSEPMGPPVKPESYHTIDLATVQKSLGAYRSRALWPTWVSSANLNVGHAFHQKLTRLAIQKYAQFTAQMMEQAGGRASPLDINNQFFNRQIKSEKEVLSNRQSMNWWPEMYQSGEWRALFKYTREACIRHVLRNGRNQTREYLEGLQLIIWAAVYTTGTSHSTHMHEQSLCSGTYYSNAPPDSVPLILSDPRGGQPMHTDMGKPEGEPEGPFFHQVSFFPKEGDMLMFPSFLPHSVPAATKNSNPRVVWAYNLEGAGDSYARMSGVDV